MVVEEREEYGQIPLEDGGMLFAHPRECKLSHLHSRSIPHAPLQSSDHQPSFLLKIMKKVGRESDPFGTQTRTDRNELERDNF